MLASIVLNLQSSGSSTGPVVVPPPTTIVAGVPVYPAAPQYTSLITSEHNQLPLFMSMVGLAASMSADAVTAAQSIQPAFDLDQAIGVQLDIIGLWVGQPRVISGVLITGFFAFADDPAALSFGELGNPSIGGIWYELGQPISGSSTLNDAQYRSVLKARIIRNQSSGDLTDIENALLTLFGVLCYVVDAGNYSLAIYVTEPISQVYQALLRSYDILPRPAGVSIGSITFSSGVITVAPPVWPAQMRAAIRSINWDTPTWGAQRAHSTVPIPIP